MREKDTIICEKEGNSVLEGQLVCVCIYVLSDIGVLFCVTILLLLWQSSK